MIEEEEKPGGDKDEEEPERSAYDKCCRFRV